MQIRIYGKSGLVEQVTADEDRCGIRVKIRTCGSELRPQLNGLMSRHYPEFVDQAPHNGMHKSFPVFGPLFDMDSSDHCEIILTPEDAAEAKILEGECFSWQGQNEIVLIIQPDGINNTRRRVASYGAEKSTGASNLHAVTCGKC